MIFRQLTCIISTPIHASTRTCLDLPGLAQNCQALLPSPAASGLHARIRGIPAACLDLLGLAYASSGFSVCAWETARAKENVNMRLMVMPLAAKSEENPPAHCGARLRRVSSQSSVISNLVLVSGLRSV